MYKARMSMILAGCFLMSCASAHFVKKDAEEGAAKAPATTTQTVEAAPTVAIAPVSAKEAGPEAGKKPPFDLNDEKIINLGKLRYVQTCAGYCHGGGGVGGRAPNFRDREDLDPEYAYKTIVNGRRASDVMPVFGNTFTSSEVWELVAYLKYLGRQKGAP